MPTSLTRLSWFMLLLSALLPTSATGAEGQLVAGRLNGLQMIASHNSFKLAMDPPLLNLLMTFSVNAQGLDYAHLPLTAQLDLGLRGLELDVVNDPQGGLYAQPLGLQMLRQFSKTPLPYDTQTMLKPGFKVMHVPDIDFRSNQPTLSGALAELRAWSDAHPRHLPIFISSNLTDKAAPVPGAVQPAPFDAAALDALDQALLAGLGADRLITPDFVRGEYSTLEQAILTRGWPQTKTLLGRFLWVLDEKSTKRKLYLSGHASLKGRVMFTTSPPGADEAAVLFINDPLRNEAKIKKLVELGYLVRTRADATTREARSGDTRRFEAAKRSRAHVISTDYYVAEPRFKTGYQVQFDDGSYCRQLPPANDQQ